MHDDAERSGSARPRGETILVVDDDEAARVQLCALLARDGYVAVPARGGVEAQWYAERHAGSLALIVTDVPAPEADGYHFGLPVGLLQYHAPVLFLSRRGREESVRRGLVHPQASFLRRPAPPALVLRRVRATIDRRRAPPAA